jgi:uncharacterized protein (DUF1015 family)
MAVIFPFKGLLPERCRVSEVVSRPFDSYTMKQVETIIKKTPNSFLSIIKPELDLGKRTKPDNPEAQRKSRKKFERFVQQGVLVPSTSEAFYIYRQVRPDFTYTGILATISATDYHNGTIKIHEQTLQKKEEKLKEYLKVVGINAEPVMFTYPHVHAIDELVNSITQSEPYADFEIEGKRHMLWEVANSELVREIESQFTTVERVYVADGHHRSASSVLLNEELSTETGDLSNTAPWSKFLGVFFPDHNMQLLEFNRLVKGLETVDSLSIIQKLSINFDVQLIHENSYHPHAPLEFSMYVDSAWYSLKLKHALINDLLSEKLDANVLTQRILNPIFGIEDLRNDDRIGFLSGLKGPSELKRLVDKGEYQIAFGLFPVRMEQFFEFSDQGRIMPPKTTWFEPKLLNGLVIYDIYPERR